MDQTGVKTPKLDHNQAGMLMISIVTSIIVPASFCVLLIVSPCMPPFLGSVLFISAPGKCILPQGIQQVLYGVFMIAYTWDVLLAWLLALFFFWYAVHFSFANYVRIIHR
jgi:hypothetical protein